MPICLILLKQMLIENCWREIFIVLYPSHWRWSFPTPVTWNSDLFRPMGCEQCVMQTDWNEPAPLGSTSWHLCDHQEKSFSRVSTTPSSLGWTHRTELWATSGSPRFQSKVTQSSLVGATGPQPSCRNVSENKWFVTGSYCVLGWFVMQQQPTDARAYSALSSK